jgi:hypothetical protein
MAYLTWGEFGGDIKTALSVIFSRCLRDIQIANEALFQDGGRRLGAFQALRFSALGAVQKPEHGSESEAAPGPRDVEIDVKYLCSSSTTNTSSPTSRTAEGGGIGRVATYRRIKSISKTFNKVLLLRDRGDGVLEFDGIKKIAATNDAVEPAPTTDER